LSNTRLYFGCMGQRYKKGFHEESPFVYSVSMVN